MGGRRRPFKIKSTGLLRVLGSYSSDYGLPPPSPPPPLFNRSAPQSCVVLLLLLLSSFCHIDNNNNNNNNKSPYYIISQSLEYGPLACFGPTQTTASPPLFNRSAELRNFCFLCLAIPIKAPVSRVRASRVAGICQLAPNSAAAKYRVRASRVFWGPTQTTARPYSIELLILLLLLLVLVLVSFCHIDDNNNNNNNNY